ncbi:DUF2726 domain-containing protein [Vibrio parahaemolyticus]|nr:DUF2726 domain-containing protein [Vibrio parahaemolyticus]
MSLMNIIDNINNMPMLLFSLLGLIVLAKVFGKRQKRKIGGRFKKVPYLNTKAEHNFFTQLTSRLSSDYHVAPKVRLADVCLPENPKNIVGFNKIARKHIDFVIVERNTGRVICAIELDDLSHKKKDSIRRDKEKDYALKSAKIPVHRVKAARNYSGNITSILNSLSDENNRKLFELTKMDKCVRCDSDNIEKVTLKWPNKGKCYYKCNACDYTTNTIEQS